MNYLNKTIQNINLPDIEYQLINYEVTEDGLNLLSQTWQDDVSLEDRHYFLEKDNIIDILTDSISGNHIVIGGKDIKGRFILSQYIVTKGLDKFHEMLGVK